MKFKFILLYIGLSTCVFTACQTSTPENLASANQQELTGNALSTNEDFSFNRKELDDEAKYPWFTETYNAYLPDEKAVAGINPLKDKLAFVIFGGVWCSDTRKALPKFYKVLESAQIPANKIKVYGVDTQKKSLEKPVNGKLKSDEFGIDRVPEFIVFYEGKEVGRLNEKPRKSLEQDLLEIIK